MVECPVLVDPDSNLAFIVHSDQFGVDMEGTYFGEDGFEGR